MSDKAVAQVLPHLKATKDPRRFQYVAAVYARGFSYRAIASVLHVTHQTVMDWVERAHAEQAAGNVQDLSGLPDPTSLSLRRRAGAPFYLSPELAASLRALNEEAKAHRSWKNDTASRAFNMLVMELTAQGVPLTAIAEAVGQQPQHLRRRLSRWQVYPEKSRSRTYPGLVGSATSQAPEAVPSPPRVRKRAEKAPQGPAEALFAPCRYRYPDCPATLGEGDCIH